MGLSDAHKGVLSMSNDAFNDAFVRPADILSRTGYNDSVVTGECHMGGFRLDDDEPESSFVAKVVR